MLDIAQQAHDLNGETVKVFLCDSTVNICFSNPRADRAICAWCKNYRKNLLNRLPKEIEILYYRDFYFPENRAAVESLTFDYDSVEAIKKLTYKNVKIGYGAFSTYVTFTRNLYPKIDDEFKSYFNRYLKAECILTELLGNILNRVRPGTVSLYNGRHFETRPVFELSKSLGYTVKCYENVRYAKNDVNYYFYKDNLPHNIKSICDSVRRTWDEADLTEDEKTARGKTFFVNRRTSQFAGDRIYTLEQKAGVLPAGFDKSKRNIIIYVSSEDEFASIDSEYDDNNIFTSQNHAAREIFNHFKNNTDIHFYLRIHPNLKNVKYKYHNDFIELGAMYRNVTIIRAGDEVSSYALLDNAEKAVGFGTNMGIEACYWGKPVILLRNAFFHYLDVNYRPQSREEAFAMIADADLPPKEITDAVKYGFYRMYDRSHKNFSAGFVSRYQNYRRVGRHIASLTYRKLRKLLDTLNRIGLYSRVEIPVEEING